MFNKTKIREAIFKTIIKDAFTYKDLIFKTLKKEGFNEIMFSEHSGFQYQYHRMEQLSSFLFGRKVSNKFKQLKEENNLAPHEQRKWNRYTKCHGVVFRNTNKVTCGNRLCPLCYSRMLYRMWGDLEPFTGQDLDLTLVIFKEQVHQYRHSW